MKSASEPSDTAPSAWLQVWSMLDSGERRNAFKVLFIAILAALASAVMVGSIMPFLGVLTDPEQIRTVPAYSWAYDRFQFESDYAFLVALGVGSVIVIAASIALQLLNIYASSRFAMGRIYSLSRRLMAGYLGQPYEHFLNHHSGEMSTRVLAEVQEVVNRFIQPAADLLTAALTIIALVVFLLWVDPIITLAAFGLLGLTYAGTFVFTRMRLNRLGKVRAHENGERYKIATEAFGGVKEIKLLGRETSYVDRFSVPSQKMTDALVQIQIMSQTPYYTIQAVALGGVIMLCLMLIGPQGLADGSTLNGLIPALGVFAFAGQRMMPELGKLYRAIAVIQSVKASVAIVYGDMQMANGVVLADRTPPARLPLTQSLVLNDVTYRYPLAEDAGVSGVSLKVLAGEKIGIVGGTGAGKTTLADLILGLLRPSSGTITADQTEITSRNIRNWQQTVGYVPQDIFLTDASIAENIALGVPAEEVDRERVVAAAKAAHIATFVMQDLPQGYDTFVGERGVRLSGGQKQRIGIARALYHDAELIVFDEATSALDNATESEVMAAIEALPGDKTVIMIAHRLSTVEKCDRIVVMDRGRMVGCGSWDTLLKTNASFQKIASLVSST